MKTLLKRTLAVLGVATLSAAGVVLSTAPAQALPASVTFSDQNCDIDTGGSFGLTVDGADFTVTNAADTDEELSYQVVLDFDYDSPYIGSVTLAAGDSERHVIPLPEDENTTVQILDLNPAVSSPIGGAVITPNCAANFSPEAVATIAAASCEFPTGGIIPPSPGFSWTFDNSAGFGPADYEFIIDGAVYESGVVAAGESRVRAVGVEPNGSGTSEIRSVDSDGTPVAVASGTYDLNCDPAPEPDYNYSPEAIGAVSDASCAIPTGGTLVTHIAGVEYSLDNTAGTTAADYAFTAGDTVVESGTVEAGDERVRSWQLDEDEATLVQVTSVDADGNPVVLDEKSVTLDCIANVPVITAPVDGSTETSNQVAISGTGVAGETITVVVADDEAFADGTADVAADIADVPVSGDFSVYTAVVDEHGMFGVRVNLANGSYGVSASATRAASDDGLVDSSTSAFSTPVLFRVEAAAVVVPGGSATPAGSLASTGFDSATGLGIAGLLLAFGAGAYLIRRRLA